jgi:hypothetical protein
MSELYATLLPTGLVKVGVGTDRRRAKAAQTYFATPVTVLARWKVACTYSAEQSAHKALKPFHTLNVAAPEFQHSARGARELFAVDRERCVYLISEVLGTPYEANGTTDWVKWRDTPEPWSTRKATVRAQKMRYVDIRLAQILSSTT